MRSRLQPPWHETCLAPFSPNPSRMPTSNRCSALAAFRSMAKGKNKSPRHRHLNFLGKELNKLRMMDAPWSLSRTAGASSLCMQAPRITGKATCFAKAVHTPLSTEGHPRWLMERHKQRQEFSRRGRMQSDYHQLLDLGCNFVLQG